MVSPPLLSSPSRTAVVGAVDGEGEDSLTSLPLPLLLDFLPPLPPSLSRFAAFLSSFLAFFSALDSDFPASFSALRLALRASFLRFLRIYSRMGSSKSIPVSSTSDPLESSSSSDASSTLFKEQKSLKTRGGCINNMMMQFSQRCQNGLVGKDGFLICTLNRLGCGIVDGIFVRLDLISVSIKDLGHLVVLHMVHSNRPSRDLPPEKKKKRKEILRSKEQTSKHQ